MKGFGENNKTKKKTRKIYTPPSKEQLVNIAIKFHTEGNISEASKYYQYFINKGFKDERVFSNYGSILKSFGKLQEAELYFRRSIELNPNYAFAYSNLGLIYRDLGKLQEAELSMNNAIQLNPNFAEAHSNLGLIYRDLGKLKEAELYTLKAIKLNPNFLDAHSNLGLIYRDLGKLKEAELYTLKAIQLNSNFAEAHSNLGLIYRDLGKLKKAELSMNNAIQLKPNFAEAYSNLGAILRDLGKLKEAELSMNKAIQLKPNFAEALSNLGAILMDLGKFKELLILSKSTLKSKSINQGFKSLALLRITITNLLQKDFSETLLYLNKTNDLINQKVISTIKNEEDKKYLSAFSQFINSLYPLLNKEDKNFCSNKIPHFGESHCLSFSHQTFSLSSQLYQVQPVLITGGKAWHFANNKNNQWKDSLTHQIKNHTYSDKVFISFGEIDCRKDEGILNYAIKYNKDISAVCEETILGYINFMEEMLSPNYSERYYFGVPAPKREEKSSNDLDIKRIEIIELYNSILKKEVLSKGCFFLDVYKLTSDNEGLNNDIYMCDNIHLSPKCLSILFNDYLQGS